MGRQTITLAILAGILIVPLCANANELITNGDFSSGFSGWTTYTQPGSNGLLSITNGGSAPSSGLNIPSNGTPYAVTDQGGPGSYSLSQSFNTPGPVNISYNFFAQDWANVTYCGNGTDALGGNPVECAWVTVLDSSQNVVATLFQGADPFANNGSGSFGTYNFSLGLTPGTYTLNFAESDNQSFFQMGVDNVSITSAATPEPSSIMLLGSGLLGLAGFVRRKICRRA